MHRCGWVEEKPSEALVCDTLHRRCTRYFARVSWLSPHTPVSTIPPLRVRKSCTFLGTSTFVIRRLWHLDMNKRTLRINGAHLPSHRLHLFSNPQFAASASRPLFLFSHRPLNLREGKIGIKAGNFVDVGQDPTVGVAGGPIFLTARPYFNPVSAVSLR